MSTSTSTSALESLVADFAGRLETIDESSLHDWQFAYKKMIFTMGMKILAQFPQNAFGPQPTLEASGGGGGGGHAGAGPSPTKSPTKGRGPFVEGGPWGPGPIIHVAIAVLELSCPPPP